MYLPANLESQFRTGFRYRELERSPRRRRRAKKFIEIDAQKSSVNDEEKLSKLLGDTKLGGQTDSKPQVSAPNEDQVSGPVIGASNMGPLLRRTLKNMTDSLLLSMPDEILIEIMKRMSPINLLRLRRSSRRFMYLFSFTDLSHLHGPPSPANIWTTTLNAQKVAIKKPVAKYKQEILGERYCSACLSNRDKRSIGGPAPELQYYHCSGCRSDHHARLFSEAQLQMPAHKRICIGREGAVKLCEHVWIRYSAVEKRKKRPKWFRSPVVAACDHPSHQFATAHHGESLENPSERPTAEFIYQSVGGRRQGCLKLSKSTHIDLALRGGQPTARELRQKLDEIEERSPSPWYPLDNPVLTPMRAVDPNRCECFKYEGADSINWPLCSGQTCDGMTHDLTQTFMNSGTSTSATLKRCEHPTSPGQTSVVLTQSRTIVLPEPWKPQWYLALDHDSYGTPAFENITWCKSKDCANYRGNQLEEPSIIYLGKDQERARMANRKCEDERKFRKKKIVV